MSILESVYKPEPDAVYSNVPNGNAEIPLVPGALRNSISSKPRVINRLGMTT